MHLFIPDPYLFAQEAVSRRGKSRNSEKLKPRMGANGKSRKAEFRIEAKTWRQKYSEQKGTKTTKREKGD